MKKNSRNPKISVIVPVYNCKYYISDCIESILSQSIESIEVIIIQNGSTDGTAEIIENYAKKDNRIHVINLKDNQGVSNARNLGLEQAKGDYVAFCDGDDTLPIYAYKEMYNIALKKDADIVIGNYLEVINGKNNYIKDVNLLLGKVNCLSYMRSSAVWNRLFKRNFLEYNKLRFSPEYSHGEDTLFIAQAYCANPIVVGTYKSVYNYMIRENATIKSLARNYCVDNLSEYIDIERQIIYLFSRKLPINVLSQYIRIRIMFIRCYWWRIPYINDKEIGFQLLKSFAEDVRKYLTYKQFQNLFFCSWRNFEIVSLDEYLLYFNLFDSKDCVLFQFKCGEIGFNYIIKFILAWISYKKIKIFGSENDICLK